MAAEANTIRWIAHHAIVEYNGLRDEKIKTNETKTSDTPDKNTIRNRVAFDLFLFLERKYTMKNTRRDIFSTLMVKGVTKNHFIINVFSDMVINRLLVSAKRQAFLNVTG